MNPAWLFHHIVDVLRSPTNRPPPRDVFCPDWLAWLLGGFAWGFFLTALIVAATE